MSTEETKTAPLRKPRDLGKFGEAHTDHESEEYELWQMGSELEIPTRVLEMILGVDQAHIARMQRKQAKLPVTAWERFEKLKTAVNIALDFKLLPCDPEQAFSILALCSTVAKLEAQLTPAEPPASE